MFKALFWFVIGVAGTVLFAAVMLFIFGQSDRLVCRHQGDNLASCSVSHVLLGRVPLPGWQAGGISEAVVEKDCHDGCTYRTALRSQGGGSRPVSEVWTDQQAQDVQLATQINAFIRDGEAPLLVVDQPPQAWVIWLLAGLTAMALVIQGLALVAQIARSLFRAKT